ncbi:hypothetical protein C8R44DRAFT_872918 [Mycena epipterygia]|nr:hypothetical protein C8R44DRAFT_872918 [Mycena epipterygia]
MYEHQPHLGSVVSTSANGRRITESSAPIDVQAERDESYYQEDIATNAALEDANFRWDLGDMSLPAEVPEADPIADGISFKKKKIRHFDEYLDEMLHLEGRGSKDAYIKCAKCGEADPLYHCAQQLCHGVWMFCAKCTVENHMQLPTHWIERWNGTYFERKSLNTDLGLKIQLGHPPGIWCPTATEAHQKFVVIDVTGIHTVAQLMRVQWWPATVADPQTCTTFAVVRLFQLLNCLGKVTGYDFLRSLELLTNNDGLDPPPVRQRSFMYIVRQYRMMLMMKRAGRGHSDTGVHGTAQGELILKCRACPQPGINLPEGWDTNNGMGHFVNYSKYSEWLKDHVSDKEISTCSGFQAMFLANRKHIKGLRTTGVGGVTCARHNMWRPNGIGDLQVGERYCNMDFILFSALLNTVFYYLILSYDIACQYSKNFWTRMFHIPVSKLRVWFKIPNFHILGHKEGCHAAYSFHWMWGAGRTHSETVEQNWEFTNGAASSTKMMGLGSCASTLEDLFGFHNWRRIVASRRIFMRRMAEDVKEGAVHREAFDVFNAALETSVPELVKIWQRWVVEWESKQHTNVTESPFDVIRKVHTMKDIRLKMANEELIESGAGVVTLRSDTPGTFIAMGLEIEQSQRLLAIDVRVIALPTDTQKTDFIRRRIAILKRIHAWRTLQRQYMPKLRTFLTTPQRALWDTEGERDAEAIRLFLPSDLAEKRKRERACVIGLPAIEEELREAEAHDTLEDLRQALRTQTMTNRFKIRNMTGQRALTRGQGVIRQINVRIHKAKIRYRYVRNALLRLRGHGVWEKALQALEEEDVCALNERAMTAEEAAKRKQLVELGELVEEGVAEMQTLAAGETRRTLSWIWYTVNAADPDNEGELVEALRVEWCKAYSRTRCWTEDVVLIEEEMGRTITFGYWSASEWEAHATARTGVNDELQEGLGTYAAEQVQRERTTCLELQKKWAVIRRKGQAYLAREALLTEDEVVIPLDEEEEDELAQEEIAPVEYDDDDDEM